MDGVLKSVASILCAGVTEPPGTVRLVVAILLRHLPSERRRPIGVGNSQNETAQHAKILQEMSLLLCPLLFVDFVPKWMACECRRDDRSDECENSSAPEFAD